MHPLKKSTSKSMTKWCKINEHLRGWVPLEPCWLKMTPPWSHLGARWPRGSIFHWFFGAILEYQNGIKINEKMKWFSDTLKNRVFCAGRSQRLQNGVPKTIQNQAFSEPAKTTESCSRQHAELVFKVWKAPKPYFFQDHFRKPSSCCTGAVVSQIFVEKTETWIACPC